jgi:hypothetical protein
MKQNLNRIFAMLALFAVAEGAALAQAVITSPGGTVALGVGQLGNLGAGSLPAGSNDAGAPFGIYYAPTMQDGVAPGCFCEGWGVSVNGTTSGGASIDNPSPGNITLSSFASTASTATSITTLNGTGLQISQAFQPSASPEVLFEDVVTLTNTGSTALTDVSYARPTDWDIPPTEFDEYVTVAGVGATDLKFSNDNGFCSVDPLTPCADIIGGTDNVNFTKVGPTDQGSDFVFDFGTLAAGASTTFDIFYGVGANEATTLAALGAVSAEVFALGYASNGPDGSANTDSPVWAFGFAGVGGTPIEPVPPSVPEPSTWVLFGTGLAGVATRVRSKLSAR